MPPAAPAYAVRPKRKFHNKSRLGCGNCKLRRVKCDEERPSCDKCKTFGVSCNYDNRTPDLQLQTKMARYLAPQPTLDVSITKSMLHMVNSSLDLDQKQRATPWWSPSSPQFSIDDLARLQRFQTRTIPSMGTPRVCDLYTRTALDLAWTRPYLMHLVQLMTALHDRYLSEPTSCRQTPTEIYHWSQAVTQFNRTLSRPINPQDRDALWMTACFIGILAISVVEASTIDDVWPLKPSSPSDLEWLRMSDGKRAIWELTDPLREDSIFHELADHLQQDYLYTLSPKPKDAILLSAFQDLCDIEDWSDTSNPYAAAVINIVPLLDMECTNLTQLKFVSVISHFTPEFKALLEHKEPRAMLLMAYWYAKVIPGQWWLSRRAKLECQATCIYLKRYHNDNKAIQDLLRFPKMKCGLLG